MSRVFYEDEARTKVLEGAKMLYEAVRTTMGPKGRNVAIDNDEGSPVITHDGVTVARGVDIDDEDETLGFKVGAKLIKEAANKMNDVAGDGTTTVTVLTYHILNEANKLITAGHNPMAIRRGLEEAGAHVISRLDEIKEDITDKQDYINHVGSISAGDKEIGELIGSIVEKLGPTGIISVEDGQGLGLESEIVDGFSFDRGFVSPYMATDNAGVQAEYERPYFLLYDGPIASIKELLPVIERVVASGRKELVVVADTVEGEALSMLIVNKLKGNFNCVAVRTPGVGDSRRDALKDLSLITGADIVGTEYGINLSEVVLDNLGTARKVRITAGDTTIIEGGGDKDAIVAHVEALSELIKTTEDQRTKEMLEKRRAALEGRVAVIRVGGTTETEITEKRFRVDDAVCAVKAALKEGIVPGGGVTLAKIANERWDFETIGSQILRKALIQPFKGIVENAGLNADALLAKVQEAELGMGVDVSGVNVELIDLKKAGVVDPVVVTKKAVENAVSIAGTGMTMGAIVVKKPKQQIIQPQMIQM